MKSFPRNLLLVFLSLGLGACATPRPRVPVAPIKAPTPPPQVIGRVSLVNTVQGFALIESSQTPETGTMLQARSMEGEESAILKVTPEKKNPFIIADIVKGKPLVGQAVTQ
jgi:hypothetical protein